MKTLPVSLLTLVIGLALGFLATRTLDSSRGTDSGESAANQRDASAISPRTSAPEAKTARRTEAKGAGRPTSHRLEKLLDLTNPYHGASPSPEFYLALGKLNAAEVMGLVAEIQDTPGSDYRTYKVRNALYAHWARLDPSAAWAAAMDEQKTGIRSQVLAAVIGEITLNDLDYAMGLVSEIENGPNKQSVLQTFIGCAADQDPQVTYDLLMKESGQQSHNQMHTLFYAWARKDPAAAIAQLDDIKGTQPRQQAISAIASALAADDPEQALAFARGITNKSEARNALGRVVGAIAGNDPQRALELLDSMPGGQQRNSALASIASAWMQSDSDAALAWVENLPPRERARALEQGMWQFIHNDVEKAVKLLESLPAGSRISHYYSNAASQWARSDPDAAMEWVKELPAGQAKTQALGGIISPLSQSDPKKAAAFLEDQGINRQNTHFIGQIVANWGATDRAAAMQWMEGLGLQGDDRSNAINSSVSYWAHQEPDAAAAYVLSLADEKDRRGAVSSLVGGWAGIDPEGAQNWIGSNLEGETKIQALGSLIGQLSHQELDTAVKIYEETISGLSNEQIEKHFSSAASQITSYWVQYDPPAAGAWLTAMPEGKQRASAIRRLVDNWGDLDVDGAAKFVLTLNEGQERDQAVETLVRDVRRTDPEAAFQWAESIGDEKRRDQLVRQTADHWKRDDPNAVRNAVNGADISDQTRDQILKSLENK